MKKVQYTLNVSVFIFLFFAISFSQTKQDKPLQINKIVVIYTDEFSDVRTGIQEFLVASQKIDDKVKVQVNNLDKKSDEMKEMVKKIHIANNCHYNCKIGQTELLINEFEKINCSFRSERDGLKQEIEKYSQEILEPVRIKIRNSLDSFAKAKGFELVLDGSKLKESAILTDWTEFPDITKEFIKFYNESFDKEKSQ